MRSTKYNKRITVQKRTETENDIGGWTNTWSDLFSCWASVIPASRSKRMEYGELKYDEFFEIEMRSRDVNPDGDCQIIYNGKPFQIISFIITDIVNIDMIR